MPSIARFDRDREVAWRVERSRGEGDLQALVPTVRETSAATGAGSQLAVDPVDELGEARIPGDVEPDGLPSPHTTSSSRRV